MSNQAMNDEDFNTMLRGVVDANRDFQHQHGGLLPDEEAMDLDDDQNGLALNNDEREVIDIGGYILNTDFEMHEIADFFSHQFVLQAHSDMALVEASFPNLLHHAVWHQVSLEF